MEKKVKRTNSAKVGRLKVVKMDNTFRSLIYDYPPHIAIMFLQLLDEFGVAPIVPSQLEQRQKMTSYMSRLMAFGLAKELPAIKNQSWAGRPAKRYRLVIPSL